jgi:drug/metabolite transporter (DMT)-like permease
MQMVLKNKERGNIMFALTLVLICIFAGAMGQICFKHGMSSMDKVNGIGDLLNFEMFFDIITNKYIFSGLFLYGSSFILWLGALSTLDLSYMSPLLSLGYLITGIFAFVFLKENITLLRWLGIALVVLGCFMISKT